MSRDLRLRAFDFSKRAFDFLAASAALLILWPVMLGTAFMVRLRLGKPVLFRQMRPGRNGVPFKLLKFRSMLDVDETHGITTNQQRLTPFGARLRSTSLDELPSLVNIVKGEMSVVGPRPLLMKYLPLYSAEQNRRHEVRPGLTGLAQINGRNALDWDSRFELDVFYVDHRSWSVDLKILVSTLGKVLHRDGIVSTGHAAGAPFLGTRSPSGVS